MIYFWSDTHFNHRGILKHTTRPFGDIREMNAWMVDVWNSAVRQERDTVFHLGDFGFSTADGEDLGEIFWRLRGKKHLIVGNHDEKNPQVLRLPWESISPLKTFKLEGVRAELCHYPLETWKGAWRGTLMLHGHCHGTLKRKVPKRFDVGVDTELGAAGPIPLSELVARAAREAFVPQDGQDGHEGRDV